MNILRASEGSTSNTGSCFQTTHWTMVLSAGHDNGPGSFGALQKLCKTYWPPIYGFVRRRGYTVEEAEDLTQEFFSRLLEKKLVSGLTREGGKFRSFLLAVLKRFLANEWHRECAQKRSGGKLSFSIDDSAEICYQRELIDPTTPETWFDRHWAATVLAQVLTRLRDEYTAAGKRVLFEGLQNFLPGAQSQLTCGEVAASLDMTEAAVRMAAHRLRRRYGELLRAEIAVTVSTPREVDEEIHYLIDVIGKR